jgi:hypothetical protein
MWNLVVVVFVAGFSGGGPHSNFEMSSVEFSSQASCEEARAAIVADLKEPVDAFTASIVERITIGEGVVSESATLKAYCLKK